MENKKEFEQALIRDLIYETAFGFDFTNSEIKDIVMQDYNDLIDLRNRIKNGTDDDTTLYEEDHLTLDHILDYMEIFMKYLKIGDKK